MSWEVPIMRVSLQKSKNRQFVYIVKDFYSNGKRTTKIMEKLGTVADLMEEKNCSYDEVLSWAKEKAKTMTENEKKEETKILLSFSTNELIPSDERRSFNCGYLFLQSILYQMKIHNIFRNISSRHKCEYSLESIFTDLIYSRVLSPSSKRSSYDFAKSLLEPPKYELEDVYRSLSVLAKEKDYIIAELYKNSHFVHPRNTSTLYYDCTNYYFEIEEEDGNKRYGKSKENRPNPIIGMGLFMDGDGIPLTYSLFPGNQNEQLSLKPLEKKMIRDFDLSKFIYCSDAGLASSSNKKFNSVHDRAYVITQSIKKLKKEDRDLALDLSRFKNTLTGDRLDMDNIDLNELYYQEIPLEGKVDERLIVTYSPKYAQYQKKIRDNQIERAKKMIQKNGKIRKRRNNPNDPARFVETIMNNENGEVIETTNQINQEKIDEEARYDGIYAISTNLEDDDVSKIIQISERRWQIEECFRNLKTEFKARPIYLQLEDRIDAHFLTCFCSLLVIRLLSNKLDNKYTIGELLETLRTMELTDTDQGSYLPSYTRTALIDDLHETFGFRTDYQILLKKKVRSIIKSTK